MTMLRTFAFAAAFAATAIVSACAGNGASGSGVNDWNSLEITLTRGVCFGACPDYSVTIHGDGRVDYDGRRFVAETGHRETRIQESAVRALFAKFMAAKFFSLNDKYHAQVTDLPTYSLTLAYDGRTKTVSDYGGRMMGMPDSVTELERAVDEAANSEQWLKTPVPPGQ